MHTPALLALANGAIFRGTAIGASGLAVGELVFNTAMSGYQEILTDPSYTEQIVTLTYPHIGNVGVNTNDQESDQVWAKGLVIRDLSLAVSNWRAEQSLSDYLVKHQIKAIADIDTRHLTHILRNEGAQGACIMAGDDIDEAKALQQARDFAGLAGQDLTQQVSTSAAYEWATPRWQLGDSVAADKAAWHVVALDFGVKHNILRCLVSSGCRVTVLPARSSVEAILSHQPDGVFLSNGPGDPAPCQDIIANIEQLLAKNVPLFGICLGHQLLALACGAQTFKMKFGHHGANHPVQDLDSQQVMISSQNHGFAVNEKTLPETLRVTHRSLFDQTIQGIAHTQKPAFSIQGHPEASPGPHDLTPLFKTFTDMMAKNNVTGAAASGSSADHSDSEAHHA